MTTNLLEKFGQVEVDLTDKISPADKNACEILQEAYDKALDAIKQQQVLVHESCSVQDELKGRLSDKYLCSDYLGNTFSENAIEQQRVKVHSLFVSNVVNWFSKQYALEFERDDARDALIPKEPNRWDYLDRQEAQERIEKMCAEYRSKMDNLHINYKEVLAWIFQQLDGFSFEEKALQEMKEQCKRASHGYNGSPNFELKKAVLSFGYGCQHSDWRDSWEIRGDMKDIIRGLIAYDTGILNEVPYNYAYLFNYNVEQQIIPIDGTKVSSVKLFKNGRVDVRFKLETYAREFVENFLA